MRRKCHLAVNDVLRFRMIDSLSLAGNVWTFVHVGIGITIDLMLSFRAIFIALRFPSIKLLSKRIHFLRLGLLHIFFLHFPSECDIQL